MKLRLIYLQTIALFLFTSFAIAQSQDGFTQTPRIKISLNQGWKFHLGDPEATFFKSNTNLSAWETVHLPHTLELTSLNLDDSPDDKSQMTFQRKVGWYQRIIRPSANSDKKVFLEFEGAHQVTTLWVNGELVGKHEVGGYTPFHFDITDFIKKGEDNRITLLVDNRRREDVPPDPGPFDYIKFSGLYRDVYLVESNPVRITFNWEDFDAGVRFTTPSVDPVNGNATLNIETTVKNESSVTRQITVINRIIDQSGVVILKLSQTKQIDANKQRVFNQIGAIEDDLHLWGINNPYLYRLNTLIYEGDQVLDGIESKVGIRKFEHHPREGFLLNGQPIKLIGMNRHQHHAYIGDAVPNSLHYKDMLQFKALGFNVVRTAHYPQDDALIEACDELGILVYEEAPTWISIGNDAWFDNLEKAARIMVRNHRNHPSVVIWGGGINHRGYVPRLHLAVKQEDPTRLTASQSSRWTGWQSSGLTDIYGQMVYGPVEWYRQEPMLAMEGRDGIAALATYKLDPLLTGIIAWTAHDHYTFHPASKDQRGRVRLVGVMNLFRYPYPETYFYPVELKEEPYLYIDSEWTENTHEIIIYSNTAEVELLLNGKSISRQKTDYQGMNSAFDHPPFRFKVDHYEAGKLTAKGWVGKHVLVEKSIYTPENASAIKLEIDTIKREFIADGSDVLLAYAYVVDKNGTIIQDKVVDIKFTLSGPGSIIGEDANIGANPMPTRFGMSPVLIKAGLQAGEITLKASANGLKPASASWKSIPSTQDQNLAEFKEYFDVETIRIDLGAEDQLLQYEWNAWNGKDGKTAQISCKQFGGFTVKLNSQSSDGWLRWLGEMNVMGKYGYAAGEGVLGIDTKGITLEFLDLPKGKYQISTYHHAPRSNTDSMDPNKNKLKTLKILDIPYAKRFKSTLHDGENKLTKTIHITEGKMLPETGVSRATFNFEHESNSSINLIINGLNQQENIWLNAIEIKRFLK